MTYTASFRSVATCTLAALGLLSGGFGTSIAEAGEGASVPAAVRRPGTPPVYPVLKITTPPKIDGQLDEACWQAAQPMGRFYQDTGDGPMHYGTFVRMVHDDTYLYLAVDCELPGASDKPIQQGSRDNVSFGGDTIELFLDADRAEPGYVQIIFDMGGAFTDMLDGMNQWNGDITAATSVDKAGWRLEVRIRKADLAGRIDKSLWGANICRSCGDESGSWADIRDSFQQPDAFGLLTFAEGALAVEDIGVGVYGWPEQTASKVPVRLRLRNPTSQPFRGTATFTAIPTDAKAHNATVPVSILAGLTLDLAGCIAPHGAPTVRVQLSAEDRGVGPLFDVELPLHYDDPAEDCLQTDSMTCAIRPEVPVATTKDQAAVYLLAQSFQGKDRQLAGCVVVRSAEDGQALTPIPVTLQLPAGGSAWQRVVLPAVGLRVGQYNVEWVLKGGATRSPLRTQVCYNPLEIRWLRDLVTPADVQVVLGKLKCPLPKDAADRAIVQVRIDRLADRVSRQAADPKAELANNIQALYTQLMQLVGQLRTSESYTTRQRGWFEYAIHSPVDDSAQPCSLFVPYDYDKHADRRYPLEVHLHAGGGTHGGAGYRAGLDRDITDRLILHPLSRGGHAGYGSVAADDVISQVRDVMARYRIDPDVVHVFGESMGGFGSFTLPAMYPDVFASARPICGGGFSSPVEQIGNTVTIAHHGLQDATVPALCSQISVLRMQAEGCPVQLYLHDGAGHGVGLAARKVTNWSTVKQIRRDPCPRTVVLAGDIPQLKQNFWLSILRYQDMHKGPYLRATFTSQNHLVLDARNVAWAKVSLPCKWIDPDRPLRISDAEGLRWTEITPGSSKAIYVRFEAGKMEASTNPDVNFDDQTVYIGGGAASMFCLGRPVRIVYGTAGSTDQTAALEKQAKDIRRWGWASGDYWSGGYPVLKDTEVTDGTLKTCDLIVLGTPADNSLLMRMAKDLPVKVAAGQVTVQSSPPMAWPEDDVQWSLFYRNPLAPAQRIWWFGGVEDRASFDKITMLSYGSFLGSYPPELIVQSRPKTLLVASAFLDSRWNLARPAPLEPAKDLWPAATDLLDELNQRFAQSFAVDAGLVSRPGTPGLLDWDRLTVGEALLTVTPDALLRATVSGEGILKARETLPKRIARRVKNPALSWALVQPDSLDPKADYQVLTSAAEGLVHQAQALGFAVRDCHLVPAEQVQAIQEHYLRDKIAATHVSATQPVAQAVQPTQIVVIGTLHGAHKTSAKYSLEVLQKIIVALKPSAILVELPPTVRGELTVQNGRIARQFDGDEDTAANLAADALGVAVIPFDREGRNEFYVKTRYFKRADDAYAGLRRWVQAQGQETPGTIPVVAYGLLESAAGKRTSWSKALARKGSTRLRTIRSLPPSTRQPMRSCQGYSPRPARRIWRASFASCGMNGKNATASWQAMS